MTDSPGEGGVTQRLRPGLHLTTGKDLFPGNLALPGTHSLPTTPTTTTITTTTLAKCHFGRSVGCHVILVYNAPHPSTV